ncbi:MAG: TetR/AcrR family transcriptional regulator [Mycobacterium sp.]
MKTDVKQSARERLLAAANDLFYAEGVQSVGIDRVIEHAGVAKASLYNTFGSKENLVQAYLESRHEATLERLRGSVARHRDPRQRLLAVFDAQAEMFAEPSFHGCAFITASAEAPDGGLIRLAADQYRAEIRGLLTDLARDAGASEPATLGRQLQLVYDGGGLAAQMDRDPDVAAAAKAAATQLLDAATR